MATTVKKLWAAFPRRMFLFWVFCIVGCIGFVFLEQYLFPTNMIPLWHSRLPDLVLDTLYIVVQIPQVAGALLAIVLPWGIIQAMASNFHSAKP
ncbi:hypothetical protein [Tritonibacter mobilis]|uniref:hypothetical protein n=1 Tax=Tritonibacter mobilis TaxID=379347 RepID=UPI000E0D38AE|nr:hypothetical protein [Tritonibacter mobilis]